MRTAAKLPDALRRRVAAVLVLGLLALGAEAEPGARAVVETTVQGVLEILATDSLPEDERRAQIEQIATERFDFATISRLVLARYWKRFSPAQREAFEREFKEHLSRNYGRRIDRYEQETVEFLGERVEPRGDVTVRTRIVGGQADGVGVDYRVRQKQGLWRVIDVVIEGVSLVSSYRSQFAEILGNGSPDRLVQRLREKNAAPEDGDEAVRAPSPTGR